MTEPNWLDQARQGRSLKRPRLDEVAPGFWVVTGASGIQIYAGEFQSAARAYEAYSFAYWLPDEPDEVCTVVLDGNWNGTGWNDVRCGKPATSCDLPSIQSAWCEQHSPTWRMR